MRRTRAALTGTLLTVLVVAAACYPPSQAPTPQAIPSGGRVVATSAALTDMTIEAASEDLSTIVFTVLPLDPGVVLGNGKFTWWVHDDQLDRNTVLPTGSTLYAGLDIAPDGRTVVFASSDPRIQVVPPPARCWHGTSPQGPPFVAATCSELYTYDLDTGERRQLTGLDGLSTRHSANPRFTEDGTGIDYSVADGRDATTLAYRHLDLATGAVTDGAPPPAEATSWDRGDHVVAWDGSTGTLTSVDDASGDVTTLWAESPVGWTLDTVRGDGRYIVLSRWEPTTDRTAYRLIDTDAGGVRVISSRWVSDDASRFAIVQVNVAPDAIDRLVLAPIQP